MRKILLLREVIVPIKDGVFMQLDPTDLIQNALLYFGEFEPLTRALLCGLAKEAKLFVDVGGHIGLFALNVARIVGDSGSVIVVEPNPRTFSFLLRNIDLNGLRNVQPILACASNRWGVIGMEMPPRHNTGLSRQSNNPAEACYQIPCCPLADLLKQLQAGRPDIVKIDVEGFESKVLEGLLCDPAYRPSNIIMEYLPRQFSEAENAVTLVRQAGYRLFDVNGHTWDTSAAPPEDYLWARLD